MLEARLNGLEAQFPHLHHEVVQAPKDPLVDWDEARIQFQIGLEGDVEGLRVELDPAVKPAEFKRLPDAKFKDRGFLQSLAGTYRIGVAEWTVTLRPDGVLMLTGRTGAPNELISIVGTCSEIMTQQGVSLRFIAREPGGAIDRLLFNCNGSASVAERMMAG